MSRLNSLNQRKLSMEGLEPRKLMTSVGVLPAVEPLPVETKSYEGKDYFVADSFSFGVEREVKESGEKGGTEDINIGVRELQECTISKSMDYASADLAQYVINGNSCGAAEIDFVEVAGGEGAGAEGKPVCYLKYKLDRAFVKSWSISGDADDRPTEPVAFYYNKVAFNYAKTADGTVLNSNHVDELMSDDEGGTEDISIGVGELHDGVYQFYAPAAAGEEMVKTWSIAFENGRINRIELISDSDPSTPDYIELEIVADQWDFVHDTAGTMQQDLRD